jgi:cell division protein FtsB
MAKRSGSGFSPLALVVGLVAVVILLAAVFPVRQIIAGSREVEVAEQTLAALREENEVLEARIAALQTDEEVERLAREQFGYVMPGEAGYVVVTPPWEADDPQPPDEPDPGVPEEPGRPWWQVLWDFLTGRDVAGDG